VAAVLLLAIVAIVVTQLPLVTVVIAAFRQVVTVVLVATLAQLLPLATPVLPATVVLIHLATVLTLVYRVIVLVVIPVSLVIVDIQVQAFLGFLVTVVYLATAAFTAVVHNYTHFQLPQLIRIQVTVI
jgi:hypothetical protein